MHALGCHLATLGALLMDSLGLTAMGTAILTMTLQRLAPSEFHYLSVLHILFIRARNRGAVEQALQWRRHLLDCFAEHHLRWLHDSNHERKLIYLILALSKGGEDSDLDVHPWPDSTLEILEYLAETYALRTTLPRSPASVSRKVVYQISDAAFRAAAAF